MATRILLCDDEPHVLLPLALKLRNAGYEVIQAEHGEDGWKKMLEAPPDLLIADCNMPHLSGIDLIARMRDTPTLAAIPRILLTAKAFEMDEDDLRTSHGISALLVKPFSPREVTALVNDILARQTAASRL